MAGIARKELSEILNQKKKESPEMRQAILGLRKEMRYAHGRRINMAIGSSSERTLFIRVVKVYDRYSKPEIITKGK